MSQLQLFLLTAGIWTAESILGAVGAAYLLWDDRFALKKVRESGVNGANVALLRERVASSFIVVVILGVMAFAGLAGFIDYPPDEPVTVGTAVVSLFISTLLSGAVVFRFIERWRASKLVERDGI